MHLKNIHLLIIHYSIMHHYYYLLSWFLIEVLNSVSGLVLDFSSHANVLNQRPSGTTGLLFPPPPPTFTSYDHQRSLENSAMKAALQLTGPLGYKSQWLAYFCCLTLYFSVYVNLTPEWRAQIKTSTCLAHFSKVTNYLCTWGVGLNRSSL